jgi:hypothetical protein
MRVDCHQSGGLIWSATAAEDAPRFACILHTGLNLPAGNASLNSLRLISNGMEATVANLPWNRVVGMIVRLKCRKQSLPILVSLLLV